MPKSVFTEAYVTFLEVLVAARKAQGLTQVELARRIGRSQQFVSFAERGTRRVDVIEFYAIAKALGVDPIRLFSQLAQRLPDHVEI